MFKFVEVGEILKPLQRKGELLASINNDYLDDILKAKALFIEIDGLSVPFFVENIHCELDTCIIEFEEFKSPEDIKKHNGNKIKLRESDINWDKIPNSQVNKIDSFIGYIISDNNTNTEYIIDMVDQFPHQLMAKVKPKLNMNKDKDIFIPLIEEFIISIEEDKKIIFMQLPDGLVE